MSLENSYPKKMAIVQHVEFVEKDGTRIGNEITLADGTTLNIIMYGKETIPGDTPVALNAAGEFTASASSQLLLEQLLVETRIMNTYLSRVVGEVFTEIDIEGDDD